MAVHQWDTHSHRGVQENRPRRAGHLPCSRGGTGPLVRAGWGAGQPAAAPAQPAAAGRAAGCACGAGAAGSPLPALRSRPRRRHPRRRSAARPAGAAWLLRAPVFAQPPPSSGAGLGLAPGSRGREVMIFQWVFVRSESAPPAGLRASLPGLFITSLPGGSAAAPGLLPATRGGGGTAGGFPSSDGPAGSAPRLGPLGASAPSLGSRPSGAAGSGGCGSICCLARERQQEKGFSEGWKKAGC